MVTKQYPPVRVSIGKLFCLKDSLFDVLPVATSHGTLCVQTAHYQVIVLHVARLYMSS